MRTRHGARSSCSHVPKVLLRMFRGGGPIPAQGRRGGLGWEGVAKHERRPVGSGEVAQESLLRTRSKGHLSRSSGEVDTDARELRLQAHPCEALPCPQGGSVPTECSLRGWRFLQGKGFSRKTEEMHWNRG